MKKMVVIAFVLVLAWFSWDLLNPRPSNPIGSAPVTTASENLDDNKPENQLPSPKANRPTPSSPNAALTATSLHKPKPPSPDAHLGPPSPATLTPETEPPHDAAVSIQAARQMAWKSMPTTPRSMDEFYGLQTLSEVHSPPHANESKHFRGFRILDKKAKYIEMRFQNAKWIVSDGETPDQLIAWPPRDTIPFKDQRNVWSLYYGEGTRLLLRHIPKVHIPELQGDFEVLSGWLFNREVIYGPVVMIGMNNAWPHEALLDQLKPRSD